MQSVRGNKLYGELRKLGLPTDLFDKGFKERLAAAQDRQSELEPVELETKEIDDPLSVLYAAGARPWRSRPFSDLCKWNALKGRKPPTASDQHST